MTEKPLKVLIVEDSPTMCSMYRIVLGDLDSSDLRFASDGIEGLDRIAQEPDFDLMIVDINMPRMDGLEFLRRARQELDTAIPAVVISTEREEVDRTAAFDAGASAFLPKPWTPGQLLAAIGEVTGRRMTE